MKRLSLSVMLVLAACGTTQVASRYVKSALVEALKGGTISVSSTESAELAGASMEIPAGALAANTTITVEPGVLSLVTDTERVSPVVSWGPVNTRFSTPVTMTVPVHSSSTVNASDLEVVLEDDSGDVVAISGLTFDATRTSVSFKVSALGSYQVRYRHTSCSTNATCGAGLVCVNGGCRSSISDGGVSGGCQTNADCGSTQQCINGVCQLRCESNAEVCDGRDNDCDGIIDEGCSTNPADGGVACSTNEACGQAGECIDGTCLPSNREVCGTSRQCASGEYCEASGATGACRPLDPSIDAGVPADGGSRCNANSECPSGFCTSTGMCLPECDSSTQVCAVDGGPIVSDGGTPSTQDDGGVRGDGGSSSGNVDGGIRPDGGSTNPADGGVGSVDGGPTNPADGGGAADAGSTVDDGGVSGDGGESVDGGR